MRLYVKVFFAYRPAPRTGEPPFNFETKLADQERDHIATRHALVVHFIEAVRGQMKSSKGIHCVYYGCDFGVVEIVDFEVMSEAISHPRQFYGLISPAGRQNVQSSSDVDQRAEIAEGLAWREEFFG